MKDRVPLYPGRVKLTPVSGQANTYDMVRADEPTQEGTPLNKATLLKDATAALFGLDNNAVPDDALAWVGRYAEHWWKKRSVNFTDSKVDISSAQPLLVAGKPLYYGNSVAYDGQKLIILNEQSIVLSSVSKTTLEQVANLAPCYVRSSSTNPNNKILYLPTGTTAGNSNTSTIYAPSSDLAYCSSSSSVKVQDVSVSSITYGEWQTMFSTNRSAYPDSGVVNGYEYMYLGVPFENLPTAPKISAGSYTGTGTYGSSNPNSLTFDFEPKFVFVSRGGKNSSYFLWVQGCNETSGEHNDDSSVVVVSWNTLSWYNTVDDLSQRNQNGTTYYYIAIG